MITAEKNFDILLIDSDPKIYNQFITIFNENILKLCTSHKQSGNQSSYNKIILKIDYATRATEGISLLQHAKKYNNHYCLVFLELSSPLLINDNIKIIKRIWKIDPHLQINCITSIDYHWYDAITQYLTINNNLSIVKKPLNYLQIIKLFYNTIKKNFLPPGSQDYNILLDNFMQQLTQDLVYNATHDFLTGLLNRKLLHNIIQYVIEHSERNKKYFAMLFLDIDNFKNINNKFGYEAGDLVLKTISKRITIILNNTDYLFRIGGDEFLGIFTNINSKKKINLIVKKISKTTKQPIKINNYYLTINYSIGIALYPQNGTTYMELLNKADTATYKAKQLGGNIFQFCSS